MLCSLFCIKAPSQGGKWKLKIQVKGPSSALRIQATTAQGRGTFLSAQRRHLLAKPAEGCYILYSVYYVLYRDSRRLTDVENKRMVTGDGGGGINWETGIDIYTLRYIK